jgi:ABC-type lipoprotein export system ATPase subunit
MAMSKSAKCIDQLFADELFDGLDRTGSAAVVSLLREYAAKAPVILVTHDDRLKSSGDRIIQVIHDGTHATVVCDEQPTVEPIVEQKPKPPIRRRVAGVDNLSKGATK